MLAHTSLPSARHSDDYAVRSCLLIDYNGPFRFSQTRNGQSAIIRPSPEEGDDVVLILKKPPSLTIGRSITVLERIIQPSYFGVSRTVKALRGFQLRLVLMTKCMSLPVSTEQHFRPNNPRLIAFTSARRSISHLHKFKPATRQTALTRR